MILDLQVFSHLPNMLTAIEYIDIYGLHSAHYSNFISSVESTKGIWGANPSYPV